MKWYMNEEEIKVAPCARCKNVYPYTSEYFHFIGNKKTAAYCTECHKLAIKMSHQVHNKTDQTKYRGRVEIRDGIKYKECTKCHQFLPHTSEFFTRSTNQAGVNGRCTKCRVEDNKGYAEKNWNKVLYYNACGSTKTRKLGKFDITPEYILELYEEQEGKCYWFGVSLDITGRGKNSLQPSLDRLDRNFGYVIGNVVLCSFAANFGRNSSTDDSWKSFLESLEQGLNYSLWRK